MAHIFKTIAFSAAFIAAAAGGIGYQYKTYRAEQDAHIFRENIILKVNDEEINTDRKTAEEIYKEYLAEHSSRVFTVHTNGQHLQVDLSPYCSHTLTERDITEASRQSFTDWLFQGKQFRGLRDTFYYNGGAEEEVKQKILSVDYTPSVDASLDPETFEVIPEIYGNEIDASLAVEAFTEAAEDGKDSLYPDSERFYLKPQVKENDVREKYAGLFSFLEWSVSYPEYDITIRAADHKDMIHAHDDGTYDIDTSFLKDELLKLSNKVDQPYESVTFKDHAGQDVSVKGGSYGPMMDNAAEMEELKALILDNASVPDRTPVWKIKPSEALNEYIEVDIADQHVYHIVNGNICCDSACVTGNTSLGRGTPTGAYFVSEKVPGKTLVGRDNSYHTWVNRWMRVTNDGVGLHDAGWRGSFGGNIYRSNGSHGCINLPPKYAYSLYDHIQVFIPVFIH